MGDPSTASRRHIALIGMAGAGKSAVARRLAERFGAPALDIDALIVQRAGATIPELFERRGEDGFRDLESRELSEVLSGPEPVIVATGGGVIVRPANVELLARRAHVIWLDVDTEILVDRLRASAVRRPLLEGDLVENVRRLAAARLAQYEASADLRVAVDAAEGVGEVADRVAALIEERGWLLEDRTIEDRASEGRSSED